MLLLILFFLIVFFIAEYKYTEYVFEQKRKKRHEERKPIYKPFKQNK